MAVTITVADVHGHATPQSFTITVVPDAADRAPSILSSYRTTTQIGQPYLYQVVGYDPDGDPLRYVLDAATYDDDGTPTPLTTIGDRQLLGTSLNNYWGHPSILAQLK